MAKVDNKYNIQINRGNVLRLKIKNKPNENGESPKFLVGDVVRFNVMKRKECANVVLQKDVTVEEECEIVRIVATADEMKIGDIIDKPVDYWYEVEINPDRANTVTILGYTDKKQGPKLLTLLPEGGDKQ
jgi:hypothetical protein